PTKNPTESPTKNPTESPTKNPTESPTKNPTASPSKGPSEPSGPVTDSPTLSPTSSPTSSPTGDQCPTSVPVVDQQPVPAPCMCGVCVDDPECNGLPLTDAGCNATCGGGCQYDFAARGPIPDALIVQVCDKGGAPIEGGNITVVFQNCGNKNNPEAAAQYSVDMDGVAVIDPTMPLVDNSNECQGEKKYKMNPFVEIFGSDEVDDDPLYIHTSCSCPLFIGARYVSDGGNFTAIVIGYKIIDAALGTFTNSIGPQDTCIEPDFCLQEDPRDCPEPTLSPTASPTMSPTRNPTESPTKNPTESPTKNPTESPTKNPTESPTKNP
ncbi:hypothetical protein ACHAXT_010850, partial [Thalassiosira profunda]